MIRESLTTNTITLDRLLVFGFGSFFYGNDDANDIDVLVVFPDDSNDSLNQYREIRKELATLGDRLGHAFDVTALTRREFKANPLRDMHTLIKLF